MGLPVSLGVVNLSMEDFEEKALNSTPTKPHVWYCYVNDTLMILHEYAIQDFTDHINSHSEHMKFTIEAEQGGHWPVTIFGHPCDSKWWQHTED